MNLYFCGMIFTAIWYYILVLYIERQHIIFKFKIDMFFGALFSLLLWPVAMVILAVVQSVIFIDWIDEKSGNGF